MSRQGTFRIRLIALRAIVAGLLALVLASPLPAQPVERAVKRDQEGTKAVSFSETGSSRKGKLYALVVGVSKYDSPGIPHLKLATKDAKDFAKFIASQKDFFDEVHVQLFTDDQATKVKIDKFLLYDVPKATAEDSVILYFSGHGSIDPMRAEDFYFLSYDSDPETPAATAVLMNGPRLFHKLKARKVLIVLDACHAATLTNFQTRSTGEAYRSLIKQYAGSGQVIMSSSQATEYSMEFPELPNGVFTHYLLEGLSGKADRDGDGIVSVDEAYDYAYAQTSRRTGGAQNPVKEGKVSGLFPLSFVKPQGTLLELTTIPGDVNVYVKNKTAPGFKLFNKTDKNGRLVVKDLPIGEQVIFRLTKDGWQDMVLDPIILSPDKREEKYPLIQLTPRLAHVTVRTNAPKVAVRLDDTDRGETDESNFLFIEDIQVEVPHEVWLRKEGFQDKKVTFTIPLRSEGRVFTFHENLVALKKAEPKPVELTLLTAPGLVDVFIGDSNIAAGQTDASGKLKLQLKGPGDVILVFRKPGHSTEKKEVALPAEGPVSVGKVNLARIEPTLKLFVDQPGAKVLVKRLSKAVKRDDPLVAYELAGTTDSNGYLAITNLPLGAQVYLKIQKDGWKEQNLGPYVFTEEKWLITVSDISLERVMIASVPPTPPAPSPVAPPPAPRPVAVTDLLVNTTPGEVAVTVDGEYKGETNGKGELRVKGVPADKPLKVVFKKRGFLTAEKSVRLAAVASTRLDAVVLNRVLTRLEASANQSYADVSVRHGANFAPSGRTDPNGKVVLEELPLDKEIYVKFKKDGWRETVLGPVTLTEQQPRAKLPEAQLELALAKSVKLETEPTGVTAKCLGAVVKKAVPTGQGTMLSDVQVGIELEIELQKSGYQTKHITLTVPLNQEGRDYRHPGKWKLERALARMELKTSQPDVTVKLNGKVVDRTGGDGRLVIDSLPVDEPLKFEFEKEGYKKRQWPTVKIPVEFQGGTYTNPKPNDVVYLDIEPKPTPAVVQRPSGGSEAPARAPSPSSRESYREPRSSQSEMPTRPSQSGRDFGGGARFPSDFK